MPKQQSIIELFKEILSATFNILVKKYSKNFVATLIVLCITLLLLALPLPNILYKITQILFFITVILLVYFRIQQEIDEKQQQKTINTEVKEKKPNKEDIKIKKQIANLIEEHTKKKQKTNATEKIMNTIVKEKKINEKYISLTRLFLGSIKELIKEEAQKLNTLEKTANTTIKEEEINKKEIRVMQQIFNLIEREEKEENTKTFAEKLSKKEQKIQKHLLEPNKPSYKV